MRGRHDRHRRKTPREQPTAAHHRRHLGLEVMQRSPSPRESRPWLGGEIRKRDAPTGLVRLRQCPADEESAAPRRGSGLACLLLFNKDAKQLRHARSFQIGHDETGCVFTGFPFRPGGKQLLGIGRWWSCTHVHARKGSDTRSRGGSLREEIRDIVAKRKRPAPKDRPLPTTR